jgi:glycosyltransferase involved in cell wall biosynthesis
MKFTIVTISYNQAQFLEKTIRSVLGQDYPVLEYIVADGGSTDGSLAIIERYRDRIARFLPGPDAGPADALNKAFAGATGEVLGFINSDDVLLPGALQRVAEFFATHPAVDFVSGHCEIINGEGTVLRRAYSDRFRHRWLVYSSCIVHQPATFFRRDLFARSGGFNPANRFSWDMELFHRFGLQQARHSLINEMLAQFRVHDSSITGVHTMNRPRLEIRDRLLREFLGRTPSRRDVWCRSLLQILRKILNPRDTAERLRHGPISGRHRKPANA